MIAVDARPPRAALGRVLKVRLSASLSVDHAAELLGTVLGERGPTLLVLELTESRVSQIRSKALQKLRTEMKPLREAVA